MSDKSFPVPPRGERRRSAPSRPVNREQLLLRSLDGEKFVEEYLPVRAIWELADRADLESFYETIEAVEGEAGCSAWDPRVLISLWLYGHSRAVERMEANWGKVPQQVVINGGFIDQGTIIAMEAQGMDLIRPLPDHASQTVAALEKRRVAPEFFPQAFR